MRILVLLLIYAHLTVKAETELAIDSNWNAVLQKYELGQATGIAVDSRAL